MSITSNDTSCGFGLLWMDERLSTGMNICPSWADISLLAQVLEEIVDDTGIWRKGMDESGSSKFSR